MVTNYLELLPYAADESAHATQFDTFEKLLIGLHHIDCFTHTAVLTFITKQLQARLTTLNCRHLLTVHCRLSFIQHYYQLLLVQLTAEEPIANSQLTELFSSILVLLLKKDSLMSLDFAFDWRPLAQFLKAVFKAPRRQKMLIGDASRLHCLYKLVTHVRKYFSSTSADEILEEYLPCINTNDFVDTLTAIGNLTLFMPTESCLQVPRRDFYWVNEIFHLWSATISMHASNMACIDLLGRLCRDNYSQSRLTDEQLVFVFDAALRLMELPIGGGLTENAQGNAVVGTNNTLSSGSMAISSDMQNIDSHITQQSLFRSRKDVGQSLATLVVFSIYQTGPSSTKYLATFFEAIQSFFHPSNYGHWSLKLITFVLHLADVLLDRINWEQSGDAPWSKEYFITEKQRSEITLILKPVVFLSMFGKNSTCVSYSHATLRKLAWIHAPSVLPDLMERIHSSLGSVTETHRMQSCLQTLSQIIQPLLHRRNFSEGVNHLTPLLWSTLPGLDMNDPSKTFATYSFYAKLCAFMPLYEITEDVSIESDPHFQVAKTASLSFQGWLSEVFTRTFHLLRHMPVMTDGSSPESNVVYSICMMCDTVIWQLEPRLFQFVLEMVVDFVKNNVLPDASFSVDYMCSVLMARDPDLVGKELIHVCTKKIRFELENGAGQVSSQNIRTGRTTETMGASNSTDASIIWYLSILGQCVPFIKVENEALLNSVLKLLQEAWDIVVSRPVYSSIASCYNKLLLGMTDTRVLDERGFLLSQNISSEDVCQIIAKQATGWGVGPMENGSSMSECVKPNWHVPSVAEKSKALSIVKIGIKDCVDKIRSIMSLQVEGGIATTNSRHSMCKQMTMLKEFFKGTVKLIGDVQSDAQYESVADEDGDDLPSLTPERSPISAGYCFSKETPEYAEVISLRKTVATLLHDLSKFFLQHWPDDVESIEIVSKIIQCYLCNRGVSRSHFDGYKHTYKFQKALMRSHSEHSKFKMYPRSLILQKIYLHHVTRLKFNAYNAPSKSSMAPRQMVDLLISDLLDLSVSEYAKVRARAQSSLQESLRCHSDSRTTVLARVFDILESTTAVIRENEKSVFKSNFWMKNETKLYSTVKGCLYALNSKEFASVGQKQVKFTTRLMVSPSIQAKLRGIHVDLILKLGLISFRNPATEQLFKFVRDSAVDKNITFSGNWDNLHGKIETKATKRRSELDDLTSALVKLSESENDTTNWKFALLLVNFFELLARIDVPVRADIVQILVRFAVSDIISVRKVAVPTLSHFLKYLKIQAGREAYLEQRPCQDVVVNLKNGPQNGSETMYIDSECGWLCWSPLVETFPSRTGLIDTDSSAHIILGMSAFMDKPFWQKFIQYNAMESTSLSDKKSSNAGTTGSAAAEESFSASMCTFYSEYFQLFRNDALYSTIAPIIVDLCVDTADRSKNRCLSEFFAGLILSFSCWNEQAKERAWKWLIPLLKKCLLAITPETLGFWDPFFRKICENCDVRRMDPLLSLVLDDVDFQLDVNSEKAFAESTKLRLQDFILTTFSTRLPSKRISSFISICLNNISHPYELVRDHLGSILWKCCSAQFLPQLQHGFVSSTDLVNHMKSRAGASDVLASLQPRDLAVRESYVKLFGQMRTQRTELDLAMQNSSVPVELTVHASEYARSTKTFLQTIACGFSYGRPYIIMPLLMSPTAAGQPFLVDIFEISKYSEQNLNAMAAYILKCLPEHSIAYQSQKRGVLLLKLLQHNVVASSKSLEDSFKKQKLRTLAVLQVFLFRHLFSMGLNMDGEQAGETCADFVACIVQTLLRDDLLEVRQLAALTMSGVVRCCESINSERLVALKYTFESWIKNSDIPVPCDLTLKHAGVLGLCSLVVSFPYDIPKWLPDVLVVLAKLTSHLQKSQHITASIKATFADFRKTHQDSWVEDVVGRRDDYREIYGNSVPHSESYRSGSPSASNKGVFTAYHLDQLEGLFQASSSSYLA